MRCFCAKKQKYKYKQKLLYPSGIKQFLLFLIIYRVLILKAFCKVRVPRNMKRLYISQESVRMGLYVENCTRCASLYNVFLHNNCYNHDVQRCYFLSHVCCEIVSHRINSHETNISPARCLIFYVERTLFSYFH